MLGRNYGHAGSLEYWSRRYDLPPVYATHNNYWLWGPPPQTVEIFIVLGGSREQLEAVYDEVTEAGAAESPYAMESRIPILICRGMRRPIEDFWRQRKAFG